MRTTTVLLLSLLLAPAAVGHAQEMSPAMRASAVSRAREIAGCIDRNHHEMQRVMRLMVAAERQRDAATDPAVRRDAEAAIEALIVRVVRVQRDARECLGTMLPEPGVSVVEQAPPPDPAADSVASTEGSLRAIERDARLADFIQVELAQQVDGAGRLDDHHVRAAVRRAVGRLERCYERYLDRGSMEARHLDLVFTLNGSGSARSVTVERSDFHDQTFERCVRSAGSSIRAPSAPRGGSAIYSYRLRFGRPSR